MRTPKEIFLTSGFTKDFKSIADSPAFEAACLHAVAQLQCEMAPTVSNGPTDPYVALDANSQMTGARRFIAILTSLHVPDKKVEPPKRPTLNYD